MLMCAIYKSTRILQREHIAVDEILVAALFRRNAVQVFQLPDVICGHPAVLATDGVAVHAALVIATEQTFQIEFHIVPGLLLTGQKGALNGLLPTDDPGVQGVLDELQRLLLNIRKLDFSRSPTMWGGTRKIRAISLIWNLRVSRN